MVKDISGTIETDNGFPLKNVKVIAIAQNTEDRYITYTDENGNYTFEDLDIGEYHIYLRDDRISSLHDIVVPGPESYTWESEEDWANAQGRERIMSTHVLDTIISNVFYLGNDPEYPPFNDLDYKWYMRETSYPLTDYDNLVGLAHYDESISGGEEFRSDRMSNETSYFSVGGGSSEGQGAAGGEPGDFDTSGDFSLGGWVKNTDPGILSDFDQAISINDPINDEELGIGTSGGDFKIGSVGNTPGTGSSVSVDEWYFMVLRYDSANNLAEGYLDGVFDYDVNPSDGSNWIPDLYEFAVGTRTAGGRSSAECNVAIPFFTSELISESVIDEIYSSVIDGYLVTEKQIISGEVTECEYLVYSSNFANNTVACTVYQDVDDDGVYENQEEFTISSGTSDIEPLSNFEDAGNTEYWIRVDMEIEESSAPSDTLNPSGAYFTLNT